MTTKVSTTQQWWISIKEHSDALVDKFTLIVSKITQLGCWVSRQVTEVSSFIPRLKLYLAFLSVFIFMTYNNMTSFWLWKSVEITLKILKIQLQGNNYELAMFSRAPYILPPLLVFVLVNQLENFPRKVSFRLGKVFWGPASVVLGRNHSQTVLFQFSNRHSSPSWYE